jgi:hypothetical protein
MREQVVLHARQRAVDDSAIGRRDYDYADAFEIELAEGDQRTPEQLFRAALEGAPPVPLIPIVHKHVLRFHLGPLTSPDHMFGWRIVTSEPDVIRLEAEGPLIRGVIVGRRISASTAALTTFVFYVRPIAARVIWALVGPMHRRAAPYLLERAAATARQAGSSPR